MGSLVADATKSVMGTKVATPRVLNRVIPNSKRTGLILILKKKVKMREGVATKIKLLCVFL